MSIKNLIKLSVHRVFRDALNMKNSFETIINKYIVKKIFLLLLILFPLFAFGKSKVEPRFQFLTPDLIARVVVDKNSTFDWMKKINNIAIKHFEETNDNRDVLILISIYKDKEPTIDISAKPKLKEKDIELLKKRIISVGTTPKTKYMDFSFSLMLKINGGANKKTDFYPHIEFPIDKELNAFKQLSLVEKSKDMQRWIKDSVIPIVAHYETIVNPRFKGILNIGKLLENKKYLDFDTEKLTDKNPYYWRAIVEMQAGNQLIPFSKICIYLSKGEFDKASKLLQIMSYFSQESTLLKTFEPLLSLKLKLINDELTAEIKKGIAMHDKQEYKKALTHYKNLLKNFSHSAWLNYEYFYTKTAEQENRTKEWQKAKKVIYSCDPMYSIDIEANSAKDGYQLFRRKEIMTLFKERKNIKKDFVKYADIAFDLENYALSGELYWLILSHFQKKVYNNRDILALFLYSIDKLGEKEIRKNFKGDFAKRFKEVEQERDIRYKSSDAYKMFKIKEDRF